MVIVILQKLNSILAQNKYASFIDEIKSGEGKLYFLYITADTLIYSAIRTTFCVYFPVK